MNTNWHLRTNRKSQTRFKAIILLILISLVFTNIPFTELHAINITPEMTQDSIPTIKNGEVGSVTVDIKFVRSVATAGAIAVATAKSSTYFVLDPQVATITWVENGPGYPYELEGSVSFNVRVLKSATTQTMPITFNVDGQIYKFDSKFKIQGDGTDNPVIDVTYSMEKGNLLPGLKNNLVVTVKNTGKYTLKESSISLTSLPEGITLNYASDTVDMGEIAPNRSITSYFPLMADSNIKSGNYPIKVDIKGVDTEKKDYNFSRNLYVPVSGQSNQTISTLSVKNINIPKEVSTGENFSLSFDIENSGSNSVGNIQIEVDVPDGLINKSRNIFIESSIYPGSNKNYSIQLTVNSDAKAKNYPIKINISSASGGDDSSKVTQYADVYVNEGSAFGSAKTPQLLIENYQYGGSHVQAGDVFNLNLTFYNTSSKNIGNVKVSISAEDGAFVPYNMSSSFYIDSIEKKSKVTKSIALSAIPDAKQKTTAVTVDMTYEDGNGNEYSAKDVISIPVSQDTRLMVEDIIAPPGLMVGQMMSSSVEFYNMGKTTLNNLRVVAEGNFDVSESTAYFAGNMEPGKSDSYDFTYIPREVGEMVGKVIFTYEDAQEVENYVEKEFSFSIMEMPPMPEFPEEMPQEGVGMSKGTVFAIVLSILAVLAVGGFFGFKKYKKKKLEKQIEIEDEAL